MIRSTSGYGLIESEGTAIGISLGHTISGSQRAGTNTIGQAFGIHRDQEPGFEARRITELPSNLYYGPSESGLYIVYDPRLSSRGRFPGEGGYEHRKPTEEEISGKIEQLIRNVLYINEHDQTGMAAAWDMLSFGLHTADEKYEEIMGALETAFLDEDVVIDGRSQFTSGLSLLVYSRIPESAKREFRERGAQRIQT